MTVTAPTARRDRGDRRRMDAGSGAADFETFCRAQHRRLVGMVGLYVGDRDLAEDFVQEAMARLWRSWTRFPTTEDAERWITRVAFNLAKSNFRTVATRRAVMERFGPGFTAPTPTGDADDVLTVRAAVASLPDRQRRVLLLRYFADLPVADVALALDCPEGTVKTLTREAIATLRRAGLEVNDD